MLLVLTCLILFVVTVPRILDFTRVIAPPNCNALIYPTESTILLKFHP